MRENSRIMERNNSIHRLESKGKFWIVLFENVRKCSHNFAFSKSKTSFSDQLNIMFFWHEKIGNIVKSIKEWVWDTMLNHMIEHPWNASLQFPQLR